MPLIIFILEIAIFIFIVQAIGFWWTFLGYVIPSILGVFLLSFQSREVMAKLQNSTLNGANPSVEILKSAAPIIGSVLLIVPGFFSRALGLVLLFPPTRWLLIFLSSFLFFRKFISRGMSLLQFGNGSFRVYTNFDRHPGSGHPHGMHGRYESGPEGFYKSHIERDVTPGSNDVIDVTPKKIESKKDE